MKTIDLNRSVYELATEYPELIDIMAGLGFGEITKKAVLHSLGKITTIPKGAHMKQIPMEKIVMTLIENGFTLAGEMPQAQAEPATPVSTPVSAPDTNREQLKAYLKRLGAGESLDSVRADFVREFGDVDASEIMQAEQELMAEGTPLEEVQKLCDVHSALFHGATREEQIANAERAVQASLQKDEATAEAYGNKMSKAAALIAIPGHPLYTLTEENKALTALLAKAKEGPAALRALLPQIREVVAHYAKKGDLLYPHLKVQYSISGPSDVMWTVDDEIRDALSALLRAENRDEAWEEQVKAVLLRAEEMIYKEENILFPICAVNFTEQEWQQIYRDSKDYAVCFGVEDVAWHEAEAGAPAQRASQSGELVLPGGHMTLEQLTALLNTIPMEITFVDADNMNRFFNEGHKAFKRPGMAIDRDVFSCHPPKVEPIVRGIIEDFRHNRRDSVPIWMDKNGKTMLVNYMAVRDKNGAYIGTVELVQDMEFAKEHFSK